LREKNPKFSAEYPGIGRDLQSASASRAHARIRHLSQAIARREIHSLLEATPARRHRRQAAGRPARPERHGARAQSREAPAHREIARAADL